MGKQKYYVVWKGVNPGIYTSWTECQLQINNYKGALYKSFSTREEAEAALSSPAHLYLQPKEKASAPLSDSALSAVGYEPDSWAVDAACSGNPGPMEYRGVDLLTGKEIFHFGPICGTNNIGEFLAIVHGLAQIKRDGIQKTIYSDSANALKWVREKKCKTQLERTEKTAAVYQLIARAEKWLQENTYTTPLLKWQTTLWGEIPADFGRK